MGSSLVNLTVHGIGDTSRELDPGEDEVWVSVSQFERVLDAVADRPDVRISFDDGNDSDVLIALPRLLERGLSAEFFVLAGQLGRPGRLGADGVRELAGAGMRVGSHGWAHRDWRLLDDDAAEQELARSHEVLQGITGQPVTRVAIPFGSYDRRVLRRLRRAGVTTAFTSDGGLARPGAWLQARNSLTRDLDARWVGQVLNGGNPMTKLAARVYKRHRL